MNESFFYRIHKEKNGRKYLKIWKLVNGKEFYVRSCGAADKLNDKLALLERYEKGSVPNQEKAGVTVPKSDTEKS